MDVRDQVANLVDRRSMAMPGVHKQRGYAVPASGSPHRWPVGPESADPDRWMGTLNRRRQQGDVPNLKVPPVMIHRLA
jgi:hypothetical protein